MMNKTLRYFLFSTFALSALFLASCEDDSEGPSSSAISLSVDGESIDGDTLIAAPGSDIEITASLGTNSTDEVTVVTNGGAVSVPSNNIITSGSSITVSVSPTAGLDDEATLTFSSGGVNRQLTIDVGYQTVVDAAMADANLSVLVEALGAASLVETLSDESADYTVFAPTNQAFEGLMTALGVTQEELLSREDLADILLYHVVDGSTMSGDLENGQIIGTQHPDGLSVAVMVDEDGNVMINGATVVTADVETGNGVVHVINQVLLPQTVAEYEAVLLAAPVGQTPGERSSTTFFSAATGGVYSVDEVVAGTEVGSADIDFGYYYGATNEASIAAPSDYPTEVYNLGANGANWSTLNETMFRPTNNLTLDDFNAISAADAARLAQEYEIATEEPVTELNNLSAGELYAFRTADNRYGIFFVEEIVDGDDDGEFDGIDDSIELQVKVTE